MITSQLLLWIIAVPMACLIAWIVKKGVDARTSFDYAFVSFLLIMMASMFGGVAIYLLNPTSIGVVEAVAVNMIVMTVGILPVLKYWAEVQPEAKSEENIESITEQVGLETSIRIGHAYVIYFVAFLASMTATGFIYIVDTGLSGLEAAVGAGAAIMTAGIIAILRYSLHRDPKIAREESMIRIPRSSLGEAIIILLVLLNEILMGWVFVMLSGIPRISGASSLLAAGITFSYVVSSYWFIFIMVIEMGLTIFVIWKELPRSFAVILALQPAVMLFSPTALSNQLWVGSAVYIGAAFMTALFIFMFEYLARNNSVNKAVADYYPKLLAVYALMIAGLYLWKLDGNEFLFAISIILEMALYFSLVMNSRRVVGAEKKSWLLDSRWAFGVLTASVHLGIFHGCALGRPGKRASESDRSSGTCSPFGSVSYDCGRRLSTISYRSSAMSPCRLGS